MSEHGMDCGKTLITGITLGLAKWSMQRILPSSLGLGGGLGAFRVLLAGQCGLDLIAIPYPSWWLRCQTRPLRGETRPRSATVEN